MVEDFVRHSDRKYVIESDGRAIRRRALFRTGSLVPIGHEANRIEDARVLGLRAVGGRAKRIVDPDPFTGSATEVARRLGVSRRTVFDRRRRMNERVARGAERLGPGERNTVRTVRVEDLLDEPELQAALAKRGRGSPERTSGPLESGRCGGSHRGAATFRSRCVMRFSSTDHRGRRRHSTLFAAR
ncbi:MAG: hypothetical protein L3K18_05040, partial [Thermoplasmata archaeon]|nr:hypothetical protein [Thermoplasmata archaeon]